jgi:glutathione-regulated potassium-efflux system ancillary protein KefG
MRRILVVLAHPHLAQSSVNLILKESIEHLSFVTLHNLYDIYPKQYIAAEREKSLVVEHEMIVFQHPVYWYSTPALLKEWQDKVLEFGWAYGPGGNALHGKWFWQVATTGGPSSSYEPLGYNRFSLEELFRPLEATVQLCGMNYAKPLYFSGARNLQAAEISDFAKQYSNQLLQFSQGINPEVHSTFRGA